MSTILDSALAAELNRETAQIAWSELARFFANGTLLYVSETLDLTLVGAAIALDDAKQIKQWMNDGLVGQVTDEQAITWQESDAVLWAQVVKPFVLAQPLKEDQSHAQHSSRSGQ